MKRDEPRARCYLTVDTGALLNNLQVTRGLMKPGTRLMAVLKADAYGYGAVQIGRILYENGVRMFAVACLEEAFALCEALHEAWILCLGETLEGNIAGAVEQGIRLTVGSRAAALAASEAAQELGVTAYAHFKVDTGLHRIGFAPDSVDEIADCACLPGLVAEGLYTHLALHSLDSDRAQYAAFEKISGGLTALGIKIGMRHMLDSIGLTRYPDWQYDAVRVGALLYGNYPNGFAGHERVLPVGGFFARITRIFAVKQGDLIGYDSSHPMERDSVIAAVSAGYVDGYPRVMSNRGFVIVRGQRARVVGLICMDQMMVDITDIPQARRGDTVTLLGQGMPLREYAQIGELNRNECTAIIGKRVPRIYL